MDRIFQLPLNERGTLLSIVSSLTLSDSMPILIHIWAEPDVNKVPLPATFKKSRGSLALENETQIDLDIDVRNL